MAIVNSFKGSSVLKLDGVWLAKSAKILPITVYHIIIYSDVSQYQREKTAVLICIEKLHNGINVFVLSLNTLVLLWIIYLI